MSKTKTHKVKDYEIDHKRTYRFKLTKPHRGRYIIPTRGMCWDEDEGRQRIVRLSSTEGATPYLDEQDENSRQSNLNLEFNDGRLSVSGKNPHVIRYLLAYDGNADKKETSPSSKHLRFKYKLEDEVKDFKNKAELRKFKNKLQNSILEASYEDLKDFLVATYDYSPKTGTVEELIEVALLKVDYEPEVVNKHFKTETSKLKSAIIQAFKDNIIRVDSDVVTWVDTGIEVGKFKPTKDKKLTDLMVDWVGKGTKESKDFIQKMAVRKK